MIVYVPFAPKLVLSFRFPSILVPLVFTPKVGSSAPAYPVIYALLLFIRTLVALP